MQQSSQGADYDPNNPYMNLPNQEWRKNAGGLSSGEIQTRNAILQGTYDGNDAQQNLTLLTIMNKNTAINFGAQYKHGYPFILQIIIKLVISMFKIT